MQVQLDVALETKPGPAPEAPRRRHVSLGEGFLCVEAFAELIDLVLLQSGLGLEELNLILSTGCSSRIVLR